MVGISPFVEPDSAFWAVKRVPISNYTGFRGSWLALWLARISGQVTGLKLAPGSISSLFNLSSVSDTETSHNISDVRDAGELRANFARSRPGIVLHLPAQAPSLPACEDPLGTFATNIKGTANLLNALTGCDGLRVAGMIITDREYENPGSTNLFHKTDMLSEHDRYSMSCDPRWQ